MSVHVEAGVIVSKSEFARRCNVSAGRVSQWIAEKKIAGPALVGAGRAAKINASVAVDQLSRTIDIGQRLANGLSTRLDFEPAPAPPAQLPPAAPAAAPEAETDNVEDKIKAARLEQIERSNRREAVDEAQHNGGLTDAATAAQEMGKLAARMVNIFAAALPDFAAAIAGKFGLGQRDVLHLLHIEYRKVRTVAERSSAQQASALPTTQGFEIADPVKESEPA